MGKLSIILIALLILNTTAVLALTEEKCVAGDGSWTEKIGCDEREGELCPQFYCKCSQGFSWNESLEKCEKISNQRLCESSEGEWIGNECVCPENSIGFKENFGCDYAQSFETDNFTKNNFLIILLVAGIILLVLLIVLVIMFKNKRK